MQKVEGSSPFIRFAEEIWFAAGAHQAPALDDLLNR